MSTFFDYYQDFMIGLAVVGGLCGFLPLRFYGWLEQKLGHGPDALHRS